MKLTSSQLRRIIKEEISRTLKLKESGRYQAKDFPNDKGEIMTMNDVRAFGASDELAAAAHEFAEASGIEEPDSFLETVKDFLVTVQDYK